MRKYGSTKFLTDVKIVTDDESVQDKSTGKGASTSQPVTASGRKHAEQPCKEIHDVSAQQSAKPSAPYQISTKQAPTKSRTRSAKR